MPRRSRSPRIRHPRPRDYLSRRGSCLGACSLGKEEILHSSKIKMFLLDPNANLTLHSPRCERQHSTWVPFGTCIMLGGELGVLPPYAIFHSAAPCHCCRLQTATGAHCCRLGPKAHQAACVQHFLSDPCRHLFIYMTSTRLNRTDQIETNQYRSRTRKKKYGQEIWR